MSILNELYRGNICPMEKYIKQDGEYRELLERAAELSQKITESLSEEGRAMWDEISDIESSMERISDRESFIDGFCLGVQIMTEVMGEDRINRTVL